MSSVINFDTKSGILGVAELLDWDLIRQDSLSINSVKILKFTVPL